MYWRTALERAESMRNEQEVEAAMGALGPEGLRETLRTALAWLEFPIRSRVVERMVARAHEAGWVPRGPTPDEVAETVAFADAARRMGCAEPWAVDEHLRRGRDAFLARDYGAAVEVFGALLGPLGDCAIYVGQEELLSDVLGVDDAECAAQFVVATYMCEAPEGRVDAVLEAIEVVRGVDSFWEPLQTMGRTAVEPLPEFDAFLVAWEQAVRRLAREDALDPAGYGPAGNWLREVVARLEGAEGLRRIAHETRRRADLRAWCGAYIEDGDWAGAFFACEEAARLVRGDGAGGDEEPDELQAEMEAELLDGAALATQELGEPDVDRWLERAWCASPNLMRLRRWLGWAREGTTAVARETVRARAEAALSSCSEDDARLRGLLLVLAGRAGEAASLLAEAPALGWSYGDHPGHVLFPLFAEALGAPMAQWEEGPWCERGLGAPRRGPKLPCPSVAELAEWAGAVEEVVEARDAVLAGMRAAAERRVEGVTSKQRRRHYGHAASLVEACAAADGSEAGVAWLEAVRERYRRYPAFTRELGAR